MPYPNEATVKRYRGMDCWRTWFLEECDEKSLFGVTAKHLPLINTDGYEPYCIGTHLFLEDAPYFRKTSQHRICGPYKVVESTPEEDKEIIRKENGKIVIYKSQNPSRGPWFDKSSVTRIMEGIKFRHPQLASEFDYYPFRFSIQHAKNFRVFFVPHSSLLCDLCFQD